MEVGGVLTYEGCNFFRQRLLLAILSGKTVRIRNIRYDDNVPGIQEHEASFIRLLDRISNGSHIEVNRTGTALLFKPGVLYGGKIDHICPESRAIGYFLEPVMMMAPFCKEPVNITFKGVTNNKIDPSIDMIKFSLLPVLEKFLVLEEGLSLKMVKRGLPPKGGGVVIFTCPVRRTLKPFQWKQSGKIQRVRGVVYTNRIAPIIGNRMLEAARGVFLNYLTDVYFNVDNAKGNSPGYGLCCYARTNMGTIYTAEAMSNHQNENLEIRLPEDVGREAAWRLLEEIHRGGCTDTLCQPLVLLFMALSPKDISKFVCGPLTPYTMHFLRHMRDFLHVTFKIEEHQEDSISFSEEEKEQRTGGKKLLLTCIGIGYSNISKGQV